MLAIYWAIVLSFFTSIKNVYGKFGEMPGGLKEYYLKLDGYFYCEDKNCNLAVIRVRNKRTIDLFPIQEIVNSKDYLKELHPMDACIIGIIAHNEQNGIINKKYTGWKKMCRIQETKGFCFIKSEAVVEIVQTYTNEDDREITVLKALHLKKRMEIPTRELCKNQALLYALNSLQAMSLGYSASECVFRENLK